MAEIIEISDDEVVTISDSDESIEFIGFIDNKLDQSKTNERDSPGPSSRQSSTDREVEPSSPIDLDRVRLPSSGDESDDDYVERDPNPMIPGKFQTIIGLLSDYCGYHHKNYYLLYELTIDLNYKSIHLDRLHSFCRLLSFVERNNFYGDSHFVTFQI